MKDVCKRCRLKGMKGDNNGVEESMSLNVKALEEGSGFRRRIARGRIYQE